MVNDPFSEVLTMANQKYLKFPGPVILNHALMEIRVDSGSHSTRENEMLKRVQHDTISCLEC